MKIKSMIAGLLAGALMMGNLSAVCFAAESGPATVSGQMAETTEAVPAESEEVAVDGAAEKPSSTAEKPAGTTEAVTGLPDGFTLGTEVVLPEGVTINEDGSFSFSLDGWDWSAGGGTEEDEPETVEETTTIGTVNVRSDTYLNLRSGSGMEHSVIGHLLRGTEVEVVGESGDWYEVVIPEATGYVHKDYLDVEERTAAVPAPDGDAGSGLDEQFLMMLLCLMMNGMDTPDTTEPASEALTPDGNLTLVDDYGEDYADGSGKQFITLVTKAGNTFYLVIDRDDKGEQTVHFMNLVDEADLLALMDEDEAAKYATPEQETPPPAETQEPEEGDGEDKPDEGESAAKSSPAPVLVLVLALIGGGGFFAYTKFFKGRKKEQAKPDPDADYSEDDEDYGLPDDLDPGDEDGSDFDAEDDEPV